MAVLLDPPMPHPPDYPSFASEGELRQELQRLQQARESASESARESASEGGGDTHPPPAAAAAAAAATATAAAGTIVSQTTSCRTGTSALAQLWQLLEYCESPRTTGTGLWTSGLRGIDKPRRAVQAG